MLSTNYKLKASAASIPAAYQTLLSEKKQTSPILTDDTICVLYALLSMKYDALFAGYKG